MFVLSKAHYYRETPQYKVRGIFKTKKLAEQYLRNLKNFDYSKREFYPSVRYKNAKFNKFGQYSFSDDGVITSWIIEEIPTYSKEEDFPPATCSIQTRGIKTLYTLQKDGSVTKEIEEAN
jgi:hypothetical protein